MAKCQIIKACGVKRRVCRDGKGRIKSNTTIGGGKKRKARKAGKRRGRKAGKRRVARAGKRKQRSLARNIKCVRTKVRGSCRQICYRKKGGKLRMISNDAAKGCGKRSIALN